MTGFPGRRLGEGASYLGSDMRGPSSSGVRSDASDGGHDRATGLRGGVSPRQFNDGVTRQVTADHPKRSTSGHGSVSRATRACPASASWARPRVVPVPVRVAPARLVAPLPPGPSTRRPRPCRGARPGPEEPVTNRVGAWSRQRGVSWPTHSTPPDRRSVVRVKVGVQAAPRTGAGDHLDRAGLRVPAEQQVVLAGQLDRLGDRAVRQGDPGAAW